jgi:DNA-binding transcriptional MocR family regulator
MYDFARGHPNRSLVPLQEMKELMVQMGGTTNTAPNDHPDACWQQAELSIFERALNYGQDEGEPELLQQVRAFLERQCATDDLGNVCNIENKNANNSFFMTGGVSHAIELLAAVTTSPGDVVYTERPTYYLVAAIMKCHGLTIESLPMRNNSSTGTGAAHDGSGRGGVDVDMLEQQLVEGSRIAPRMIYLIPTHQNPTGTTMGIRDRRKLAELAARYHILVVADEVYHLLDWRQQQQQHNDHVNDASNAVGPRPARMAVLNPPVSPTVAATKETTATTNKSSRDMLLSGCCSVSSFTKIYGPGVRCGWIEGPPAIIQAVVNYGYIQSQGGVAPLTGEIMRRALASGQVDRVLTKLQDSYRIRSQLLCDILLLRVDDKAQIRAFRPIGGYFVWIQFPVAMGHVADFLDYCRPRVNFMPGPQCDAVDDTVITTGYGDAANGALLLSSFARLCFADMDIGDLEAGAHLLLAKFRAYMETR